MLLPPCVVKYLIQIFFREINTLSVAKSKVAEALDLAAGIPTDVTFQVHDGEKGVREFKAHKFCLALVSEVFKARLFGSLRETADILDVKGTTPQAFETMISFIYHRNCQWKMKTLEELIEVANIAEIYDVGDFISRVKNVV